MAQIEDMAEEAAQLANSGDFGTARELMLKCQALCPAAGDKELSQQVDEFASKLPGADANHRVLQAGRSPTTAVPGGGAVAGAQAAVAASTMEDKDLLGMDEAAALAAVEREIEEQMERNHYIELARAEKARR